jgi:hypothetical protein
LGTVDRLRKHGVAVNSVKSSQNSEGC